MLERNGLELLPDRLVANDGRDFVAGHDEGGLKLELFQALVQFTRRDAVAADELFDSRSVKAIAVPRFRRRYHTFPAQPRKSRAGAVSVAAELRFGQHLEVRRALVRTEQRFNGTDERRLACALRPEDEKEPPQLLRAD